MRDNDRSREWVAQIDIPRRQISAAVHMFFKRHDPVVIHSIAATGRQLLTDFGSKSRLDGLRKGKDDQRALNDAADFFKQADRDPRGRIDVEPLTAVNAELLMDGILMLHQLDVPIAVDMRIFWSWFAMTHADLFNMSMETMPRLNDNDVDPDDFDQIASLIAFLEITDDGPPES